jgi:outer membrane protein
MKKVLLSIIIICSVFCTANAQKIGHFSYNAILNGLPAYVSGMQDIERMRKQYADELQASEKEFSEKYELFIEQQSDLAPSISEKRRTELQDLYDSNIKFRDDSQRLLKQSEQDLLTPLKEKIRQALISIGKQGGYTMIVNTDSDACPYIDDALTVDVTESLLQLLR